MNLGSGKSREFNAITMSIPKCWKSKIPGATGRTQITGQITLKITSLRCLARIGKILRCVFYIEKNSKDRGKIRLSAKLNVMELCKVMNNECNKILQ